MPLHDFRCNKCLFYWEDLWFISEHEANMKKIKDKEYKCPNCDSTDIVKFINVPGIKFTGKPGDSGFYSLDYANVKEKITKDTSNDDKSDGKSFDQKMKDIYKK